MSKERKPSPFSVHSANENPPVILPRKAMAVGRAGLFDPHRRLEHSHHAEQKSPQLPPYRGGRNAASGKGGRAVNASGPLAALLAGLLTSLHCAGMCGPLACAVCSKNNGSMTAAALYNASRVLSYSVVGFFAGWMGRAVSDVLLGGATRWLTWAFVVFFVVVATGLDKRMRIPIAGAWMARCLGGSDASLLRASLLGALTPFIPCGPLYLILAAAAFAGSAAAGATILFAFALGTVPLMFALQSQYFRIGATFSPATLDIVRRTLAAMSVALLVYRGTGDPSVFCQ